MKMWPRRIDWTALRFGVEIEFVDADPHSRLSVAGARATWSCGLRVHVGVEAWGKTIIVPMLDAALQCQVGLQALFQTSHHRLTFCHRYTKDEGGLLRSPREGCTWLPRPSGGTPLWD